ncbi:MAG: dephospho-CoA kinase, partial [Thermostichales cyanobacterium GMQP_bins_62]
MTQRLIGLTGSLGSGKTTAATYLRHRSIPVFDADQVARHLLTPGSPILETVINHFGPTILDPQGNLDRLTLAEIIFRDPQERRWLEQLIHPQVRQQAQEFIAKHQDPVVVLDVPLLFEAGMEDLVTEIWVVSCGCEQQWQRLRRRHPHWSPEHIQARLAQQWPLAEKVARADRV